MISRLTAPLDAIRNSTNILEDWTQECQENFDALKAILPYTPSLLFPNFEHPFCVATNAFDVGISAVLYQIMDGHDITTVNA